MSAWHTVHVRVSDAATGQPTPVRIRFQAKGHSLAPFGRVNSFSVRPGVDVGGQVRLGGQPYFYIDGTCEIRLPAGEVIIEVSKGPEFVPQRKVVTLAPGQISLRLTVERWIDLRRQGWYSGDTRVHFLTPHAALLEGAAEDVAVVNLLACQRRSVTDPSAQCLSNILAFSGQSPALERPGYLVVVNTLNVHPELGTLGLLNCHRAIYPLRLRKDRIDRTLADWCDQCHRKKTGLVVWSDDSFLPRLVPCEALADLILGKVDAFEIIRPLSVDEWGNLLNAGLRVPLVGGSGKDSNARPLGHLRTYAYLGEGKELTYADWIEAVRGGRTFATSGPLVTLSVDGQGPGAVLRVEPGRRLTLKAEARSARPFPSLEVTVNGSVRASGKSSEGWEAAVEIDWLAEQSAWIAARCWDQQPSDEWGDFAQTSPVYVEVIGRPFLPQPSMIQSLVACLDEIVPRVTRWACSETEQQRQPLLSLIASARTRLLRGKASDG